MSKKGSKTKDDSEEDIGVLAAKLTRVEDKIDKLEKLTIQIADDNRNFASELSVKISSLTTGTGGRGATKAKAKITGDEAKITTGKQLLVQSFQDDEAKAIKTYKITKDMLKKYDKDAKSNPTWADKLKKAKTDADKLKIKATYMWDVFGADKNSDFRKLCTSQHTIYKNEWNARHKTPAKADKNSDESDQESDEESAKKSSKSSKSSKSPKSSKSTKKTPTKSSKSKKGKSDESDESEESEKNEDSE